MEEIVLECDCFISVETSKALQLINHSEINQYEECVIKSAKYKHKIPELEFIVEYPTLEAFCKPDFEKTQIKLKTQIDQLALSKNNFAINIIGNEAHFVPLGRPILKSFTCNIAEVEFKKTICPDNKLSLDEFHSSCHDGVFHHLSSSEKITQPFIPASYIPCDEETVAFERDILRCYGRENLRDLETTDKNLLSMINNMIKTKSSAIVKRDKPTKIFSLESEILNIMLKHKVVKFNIIIDTLKDMRGIQSTNVTEKSVLNYLPTVALMLRGYWVIKSDVLYRMRPGKHTFSSDSMVPARDYVMCLFHENIDTYPKKIQSVTKIPSLEATELLEQFAVRVTDSNTGKIHWKYHENSFEFINKHHELNQEHNLIIDRKKLEVCLNFKLQSLFGDTCSSKPSRRRSISSQYESSNSLKRKTSMELSSPLNSVKRLRLNSTAFDNKDIDYNINSTAVFVELKVPNESPLEEDNRTNDNVTVKTLTPELSVMTTEDCITEEITSMMNFMKEEPVLSPADNDVDYNVEDNHSYIKTELSEATSIGRTETNVPDSFPSLNIYKSIKLFIGNKLDSNVILPVNDLAITYQKDILHTIPIIDYEQWTSLNRGEIIGKLEMCVCVVLDEYNATKIEFQWPSVPTSLPQQTLYLSTNKTIRDDRLFVNKMLEAIRQTGSVTLGELKKLMTADLSTKHLVQSNGNMLRDKLQKYCVYQYRKYFLKNTVPNK